EILPQAGITTASAQRNFVDSVRAVTPAATGLAVVQTLAGEAVVDAFQQAFLTAIVMVALVLWLVLRRPRDVMVVLAPLMIAALATIAVMTWFGMPFNFANVIALPLLLGIGVDNGIHMVWRHRQSTMEVLGSSTALAIVFSALTTIAGFGNLAFSGHSGSASMGQVLTIGMIATTLFTLLLIPPLLRWRS
ncbi:MAG: MMPL family transporter, partial [Gammaproteobacteria bacterium]|nr:MMPL family transporter [Gammaproteobacteria bacterium]